MINRYFTVRVLCVEQCLGFVEGFLQALMLKCGNQEIQNVWDSVLQTYKECYFCGLQMVLLHA